MNISDGKHVNLLVFMKDKRVVRYAELTREIYFIVPEGANGWSPKEAVFPVTPDQQGRLMVRCAK